MDNQRKQIKKIIILLIFIVIIYQIYDLTYKARYGDILSNMNIMNVPDSIKCFFGEDGCTDGNLDGWSIVSLILYAIIGYILPDQYLFIIFISIFIEIIKPTIGTNAKYIIEPLINLTGYTIGSVMSKKKKFNKKYELFVTDMYRRGLEQEKMKYKIKSACEADETVPRYSGFQGMNTSLCGISLTDNYIDPRERVTYFSEADDFEKKGRYAFVHHDVLEEEML